MKKYTLKIDLYKYTHKVCYTPYQSIGC